MGFEIRLAKNEEEKMAVYRLRYQVYIREMELKQTYVDHDAKIIKEPFDDYAHQIVAVEDGVVVGTQRVNFRKDGPLECEELFKLEKFGPFYPDGVAMSTKFMVAASHRNTAAAMLIGSYAYKFCRESGVELNFIDAKPHLLRFYQQMGYRLYMENIHHPDYGDSIPMVFLANDHEYLQEIRSPFLRLARHFKDSDLARKHFAKNFADYAAIRPMFTLPADSLWENFAADLNTNPRDILTFLKDFTDEEARGLLAQVDVIKYETGDIVVKEGTESNGIFCIVEGQVEVMNGDPVRGQVAAVLGQGDTFGEIGFISRVKRTASIVVKSPSKILVLSETEFKKLVKNRQDLAIKLITNLFSILVQRFNEKSQALAEMKNHVDRLSKSLEARLEGMDEQIKMLYDQETVDDQSASRTMKDLAEPRGKKKTARKKKAAAKKKPAAKKKKAPVKTAKKAKKKVAKKTKKKVVKKATKKAASKKKAAKKTAKKATRKAVSKKKAAPKKAGKKVVKKAAKKKAKSTRKKR